MNTLHTTPTVIKQTVTTIGKVLVENLSQHPIHKKYNKSRSCDQMVESISMTGDKPIYSIVVVRDPLNEGKFLIISGMIRFDALVNSGVDVVEVIIIELINDEEIEKYIIELNKQKVQDGYEKMMVFMFYLNLYQQRKGVKGNGRYNKIGKSTNMGYDRVKDLVMLINFFSGDGEIIIEKVFGDELSLKEAFQIKKVVEQHIEQFGTPESFEKISNPDFDFGIEIDHRQASSPANGARV